MQFFNNILLYDKKIPPIALYLDISFSLRPISNQKCQQ